MIYHYHEFQDQKKEGKIENQIPEFLNVDELKKDVC